MTADKLLDANLIATHAHQVLLARKSGLRLDASCWDGGGLGDAELQALVGHQKDFLAAPVEELQLWAGGAHSTFNPREDLKPILESKLRPAAAMLPVNILIEWLSNKSQALSPERAEEHSKATRVKALASLLQMMLDIERDGDVLQDMFRLYHALGLPVHLGQMGIAADNLEDCLQIGTELSPRMCPSPFQTDPRTLQMLFQKIRNWGRRYTGERDKTVLAEELLAEPDIAALVPRIRRMPAEKIAVIGHSFTMDVNWSSPSAFVPIVSEIFKALNPRVELKQWARGGLTFSRAYSNLKFHDEVMAWQAQRVLLVLATVAKEDGDALSKMSAAFSQAGVKVMLFDGLSPSQAGLSWDVPRNPGAGIPNVIAVRKLLDQAPDSGQFLSLDGIHMTEPYHRLMAKEWLKYLLGVRTEKL